jgi:hypothetical protein
MFDFYQQLVWWILLLENTLVTVHICSGYSNNVKLGFDCCAYVFKLSYNTFPRITALGKHMQLNFLYRY